MDTSQWKLCVALLIPIVVGDLPVHCLPDDVEGTWEFVLSASSDSRSSCGHAHPDNTMSEPLVGGQQWRPLGSSSLKVELKHGSDATLADPSGGTSSGSWTMISDEALEVRVGAWELLAFFNFEPLAADNGGDHLPLLLQKAHSRCNETVMGWFRDGDRNSWGCWQGHRVVDDSVHDSFLQQHRRALRGLKKISLVDQSRSDTRQSTSLDWRNVSGARWVDAPVQQGLCGSCYAIAAVQMLSARHRIASGSADAEGFSAGFPLYCSEYTEGCQGGYPYLTSKWSEDVGLLPDSCLPYTVDGSCALQCSVETLPVEKRFRASSHRYIKGGEDTIMDELSKGPVAISFQSDASLKEYTGGVWEPPPLDTSDQDGAVIPSHSALLVGYGEDSQAGSYWTIQNAWGPEWGEQGSFRIRRDVARDRGLESLVVVADVIQDEKPNILNAFAASIGAPSAVSLLGIKSSSSSSMAQHPGKAICKVPGREEGEDPIFVRINPESNFRSLSFGGSSGTETAVKCAGDVSQPCADLLTASGKDADLPDCTSSSSCDCDLHGAELPFPGMQALAEKVALLCTASDTPTRALMIGLGGGAVSSYLRDRCPAGRLTLDNVEKDSRVASLASQFFGFHADDHSSLEVTDGLTSVQNQAPNTYDAIIVDCFMGQDRVPPGCRDQEFLNAAVRALKPDGFVVQNIWSRSSASTLVEAEFNETLSVYQTAFGAAPFKELAFDAPQSKQYMLFGLKGHKWDELMPMDDA